MGKKKETKTTPSYLDPKVNHKDSSNSTKQTLTQAKILGLVGKHAGSKPLDKIKNSLRRRSSQVAILNKIKEVFNKKEESSLVMD